MLAIRGINSTIVKELLRILPVHELVTSVDRNDLMPVGYGFDRYLFCQGLIFDRPMLDQSVAERELSRIVNLTYIVDNCDRILEVNNSARICVIGSESGFKGSYDGSYAHAKKELHDYVVNKALQSPDQQLICIAPTIIGDAGMTLRRLDTDNLAKRKADHPKGRFITSMEVARLVHFCLYVDNGYLSNTVIRMNGGEHLAMKGRWP